MCRGLEGCQPESPKVPRHSSPTSKLWGLEGEHVSKLLPLTVEAGASKLLPVMEMFAWGIREAVNRSQSD